MTPFAQQKNGLFLPVGMPGTRQIKGPGGICLDPMSGSGTAAVAAYSLGRRFICIEANSIGCDITEERLEELFETNDEFPLQFKPNGQISCIHRIDWQDGLNPDWFGGDCFLICGDTLQVLRSMPDSFVDLIYFDPPFNKGRTFKGKITKGKHKGKEVSFSDKWEWDDPAAQRLAEIETIPASMFAGEAQRELVVSLIQNLVKADPSNASYLSFMLPILIELKRVCGSFEWQSVIPML